MHTPIDLGTFTPPEPAEKKPTTELDSLSADTDIPIMLTPIEERIVIAATKGSTTKTIATSIGLPLSAVNNVLKRKDVKEYIKEMVDIRNDAIKNYLPGLLMDIIEDKIAKAEEEDIRLADTSRKDIVEIAKQLSEVVKTTDDNTGPADAFTNIYQQINNIQSN